MTAVADMLVVTTVAERAAEAAAVAMAVVPVAARWRWRGWAVAGVGGGEGRQPCDRAAVEMGGGKGGGGDSDGEPTVRAKCRLILCRLLLTITPRGQCHKSRTCFFSRPSSMAEC